LKQQNLLKRKVSMSKSKIVLLGAFVCVSVFYSNLSHTAAVPPAPTLAQTIDAAQSGDISVIRAFIKAGGNVNEQSRGNGYTLLAVAAAHGRTSILEELIRAGANINFQNQHNLDTTALHYAVAGNQPGSVRVLLRHGANINLADVTGRTPRAIAERYLRSLKELLNSTTDETELQTLLNEKDRCEEIIELLTAHQHHH
jgi:hypothetical protein